MCSFHSGGTRLRRRIHAHTHTTYSATVKDGDFFFFFKWSFGGKVSWLAASFIQLFVMLSAIAVIVSILLFFKDNCRVWLPVFISDWRVFVAHLLYCSVVFVHFALTRTVKPHYKQVIVIPNYFLVQIHSTVLSLFTSHVVPLVMFQAFQQHVLFLLCDLNRSLFLSSQC